MHKSWLMLLCLPGAHALAGEGSSEQDYFQDFPVVLSASRLSQPLSEVPNAMTVINRKMIEASGFRQIPDLFKLVPGMYVSYYKGTQAIVSYHGSTDQYARRMQVLVDGRSVYTAPENSVDWSSLPVTIEDIERIEVIRGPAAASHGANSTQGVINIITRDAGELDGQSVTYAHGSKGVNDATARIGRRGGDLDYRMTVGYRADNGYDALTQPPNNLAVAPGYLHNSNDSDQKRLANFRANYHPGGDDSYEFLAGYSHDVRGVGFNDKNPNALNQFSTNANMFHDLIASTGYVQAHWRHVMAGTSEFNLRLHHGENRWHEAFPAYVFGIYFPVPSMQWMNATRDNVEMQHTWQTSENNRLVYGAGWEQDVARGSMYLQPLAYSASNTVKQRTTRFFFHDEWRLTDELLVNAGGMQEQTELGRHDFSPRASLNYHLAPGHTVRIGYSVASRNPAILEDRMPSLYVGTLAVPATTITSPGLKPEHLYSREVGYMAEFPDLGSVLDARIYRDHLLNGAYIGNDPVTRRFQILNGMNAEFRGLELTLKQGWASGQELMLGLSHQWAFSNGPQMAAAGINYFLSVDPNNKDLLSASIPKNNASLLYSFQLPQDYAFSLGYYYQDALQPVDRGRMDYQMIQRRVDVRLARSFRSAGETRGTLSLVVQNLFNQGYTEFIASNLFNRRGYLKLELGW